MVHMDSISEELHSQDDNNFAPPGSPVVEASHQQQQQQQLHEPAGNQHNIILYPFAHQVGGHTQLLTLDKGTLCKPLIPRELLFYLNVPSELVKFVPAYKGVVQIRETGAGSYPPLVYQPLRSPRSPYAAGKGAEFATNSTANSHNSNNGISSISGSANNNNNNNNALDNCYPTSKHHSHTSHHHHNHHHHHYHGKHNHQQRNVDSSRSVTDLFEAGRGCPSPLELKVQIRPCSDEKILKKNLSQDNLLRADYISRPNEKYLLLLENVASKYQLPCILDLKMGTRQHGDDATEEKRHRQIAKCQASTSASLGVRLCGMQVYQVDYGGFLWYDKYYGRKMDEEGLKRALHQYFRNGSQLNEDIIDDVIDRLKLLSKAVEKSPSFRFYGTSLLIIHEGCTPSRSASAAKRCPVDVRLIDFAHTICDYTNTTGRSSSSPSVLKSSSADHLTLKQQPQQQQQQSAQLQPQQPAVAPAPPQLLQSEPLTSPRLTSGNDDGLSKRDDLENCRPAPIELVSGRPADHLKQGLAGPPAAPSSPRGEQERANRLELLDDDEDHGVVVSDHEHDDDDDESAESDIENNNNNSNSNSNNTNLDASGRDGGIGSALRKAACKQDSSVESLCEIDLTSTSADSNTNILLKQEPQANSVADGGNTTNTNNNDENIAITQINSTPTTPPSLGSRKISKTSIGPDKGLLFGLENLMRLLVDLKSETLITC